MTGSGTQDLDYTEADEEAADELLEAIEELSLIHI